MTLRSPAQVLLTRRMPPTPGCLVDGVLERLSVLLSEYPALGCTVALVLLIPGLIPNYSSSSVGLMVPTFCLQCLCFAVVALSAHLYDMARRRLQTLATASCQRTTDGTMTIRRDLSFGDQHFQEKFESLRARSLFWRGLDWLSLGFAAECHLKMLIVRECRRSAAFFQLWALCQSLLTLFRVRNRTNFSSSTCSMLSLASQLYAWSSHVFFLWTGDCCFGSFGAGLFASDSVLSQTLASCATFFVMYLLCPVSQPYVPLKTAICFVGSVVSCYMHIMVRNCTLDAAIDPDKWSFYWMFSGLVAVAAVCFNVSWTLSEAGMSPYLLTRPDPRRSASSNK